MKDSKIGKIKGGGCPIKSHRYVKLKGQSWIPKIRSQLELLSLPLRVLYKRTRSGISKNCSQLWRLAFRNAVQDSYMCVVVKGHSWFRIFRSQLWRGALPSAMWPMCLKLLKRPISSMNTATYEFLKIIWQ